MNIFNKFKKKKPVIFGVTSYETESNIKREYRNYDSKLLKKYGDCEPFNKNIKMLIYADSHGKIIYENKDYDFSMVDDYDVCLLLGDISCDDIREILKYVDKNKIYGILGNHDYFDNLDKFDIPNINGEIININGVEILGIEGSIKYKENQPGFTIDDGMNFVDTLPKCDILISHSPPFGALGMEHNSVHLGAPYVNKYIFKNRCPIVISGHNHINTGYDMINNTRGYSVYKQKVIEFKNGKLVDNF